MDVRTQNDKKLQYKLSKCPNVKKFADCADHEINVCGYMFYTDTTANSETAKMILTIVDGEGNDFFFEWKRFHVFTGDKVNFGCPGYSRYFLGSGQHDWFTVNDRLALGESGDCF